MTNVRTCGAVWISTFITAVALAACGTTATVQGGGAAIPGGAEVAASAVAPADAGPTTTTTIALGSGGTLDGSKLTSTSTQAVEAAVDGGAKGPHSIEIGRGTKDIQAIIVARRDDARACYDAAIPSHPGIEGNLDIQWTIDPKGNVTDISVDTSHSDILEPTVGNCVIAIIKKIHFNESAKGFETRTHYPFNFHPRSGGARVASPDGGSGR